MKARSFLAFATICVVLVLTAFGHAEDMRAMVIEAREKKEALLEKANLEKERALKDAQEARSRIMADKKALMAAIKRLKEKNRKLKEENRNLKAGLEALKRKEKDLLAQREEIEGNVRELVGVIRMNAKDLDALLRQSIQSAFLGDREEPLQSIMNQLEFPGMDDIRNMVEIIFDEIIMSGQVRVIKGSFVDRAGQEATGEILILGNFSAAYRIPQETGFLLYSESSHRLFALSKLPPRRMIKKLNAYMDGKSEDVPIDMSKGAALRQLTHRLSLVEQIPKGGPIVWPIIGIGALSLLIILERSDHKRPEERIPQFLKFFLKFPLPVEVIKFGWRSTKKKIEELGCQAELRRIIGDPFITDNANYILDCDFNRIKNPVELETMLNNIPGVVENGLFIDLVDEVIVGGKQGITTLER